ncbi:unnamed protein product [Adineta ricciae]|uniref:Uncharacterized protein n=1 Tax=Adineta ricciae TaxID=249248 RepID=A0A814NMM2_ADIRI|nr:unnamed protein product [Adineta ricciae]
MFSAILNTLLSIIHQLYERNYTILFVITCLGILAWLFNKFWMNRLLYSNVQSMKNKTVLITGGNAGIGYETAKDLLKRDARVVIACRNIDKGHRAITKLHLETGCKKDNIRLMECDLSSLNSVRKFAKLYNEKEDRLDVLICNAGRVYTPTLYTKDGFNDIMQSNYLGHFLLIQLLLEKLKQCRPSRIINVSSVAHKYPPANQGIIALTNFKSDAVWGSYCPSKASQILSAYKLKHDLYDDGVDIFAINPGWVWTSFQDPLHPAVGTWLFLILCPLLRVAKFIFAKTPYIGSRTTVFCAVEPSLEHSKHLYFENCAPSKPAAYCTDEESAEILWKLSCEATMPVTTADDMFSMVHRFFEQYRTAVFVLVGTFMAGWLYNKLWVNRKFYPSTQTMSNKTVVITGGNAGIGYETAKDLLQRGARVIIVCRSMNKGHDAVQRLRSETNCDEKSLRLMECDLCSLDSVRSFARKYNNEEDRLDILICNAGIAWSPDAVTKDGFNPVIQANYLGHFLLTQLLLDKLKKCRPSRIVNVASGAHKSIRSIDWSDAFTQMKSFRLWGAYPASKAFQILLTHKLKQDLLEKEGINAFSVCPGWVWTSIQSPMQDALGIFGFLIAYPILRLLKVALAKTPETGARTTIFCAVEPTLEQSHELHFESCKAAQPTSLCTDNTTADHLWKLKRQWTGSQQDLLVNQAIQAMYNSKLYVAV